MQAKAGGEVTTLLVQWVDGNEEALERLTPLVYSELRGLAHRHMRREGDEHLLQTTALVHEAYLRLVGLDIDWRGRGHFFAIASRLMRRVLVDFARTEKSQKRGGSAPHVALEESLLEAPERPPDMLRLDDAIEALSVLDERKARVVELRFFAGMTIAETGKILSLSHATVERDLQLAKAWLVRELNSEESRHRP